MLRARGVCKSYGATPVLTGVDVTIDAGQIVALLGPNGAGKTTLVSIVAGLRRPDRGSVEVGGVDAGRAPREAQSHIGLAPQDLAIYPSLTVRQNLQVFAELAGLSGHAVRARTDEVAEAVGLVGLLGRTAWTLSGGEKRRVHTAIAL